MTPASATTSALAAVTNGGSNTAPRPWERQGATTGGLASTSYGGGYGSTMHNRCVAAPAGGCSRPAAMAVHGFPVVPKVPGCQPPPAPHCCLDHFLPTRCRPYGGVGTGGMYGGAGYGSSMYGGASSMYGGASSMYGGGYGAGAGMYGRPGMYGGGGMYGSGELAAGKGAAAFCNPGGL